MGLHEQERVARAVRNVKVMAAVAKISRVENFAGESCRSTSMQSAS